MVLFEAPKTLEKDMKRLITATFALIAFVYANGLSVSANSGMWQASYFGTPHFDSDPIIKRSESGIDANWGTGSPENWFPSDQFAVRWTRQIDVETAAIYRVTGRADDGLQVFVDGEMVVDASQSYGKPISADIVLTPGIRTVVVEYIETTGEAFVRADISPAFNAGWVGMYYDHVNLREPAVLVRHDPKISFDWGFGSPDSEISADKFSVRWRQSVYVEEPTTYCFRANALDGVRIYVDGNRILNAWRTDGTSQFSEIELRPGIHELTVEYTDREGRAYVYLDYKPITQIGSDVLGQWNGLYFNNGEPTGCPVATSSAKDLSFNWGEGSPDSNVKSDRFTARWTKTLNVRERATYCFRATAGDGVRVFLDEETVIDGWNSRGVSQFGEMTLEPGSYDLAVEYINRRGNAFIYFSYVPLEFFAKNTSGLWRGFYFNNTDVAGCPVATSSSETVGFDLGADAPATGVNPNRWSARWIGGINLDQTDTYCLSLTTEDSVRLWVDNYLLIDGWRGGRGNALVEEARLAKGYHTVRIEYFDRSGDASLDFDFFPLTPLVDVYEVGQWHANYYNGSNPERCPAAVGKLDKLNVSWGQGSPSAVVGDDNFSASFTKKVSFAETSTYCFTALADNGMRVFVDGERVVNAWNGQAGQRAIGSQFVTAGLHDVRIEYSARRGAAYLNFDFFPIREINANSAEPGEWLAFYYGNRGLSGCPTVIRSEPSLNFNWGEESPDESINGDNFSARWRKGVFVQEESTYCFQLRADEGARVFVNGDRVMNEWSARRRNRSETAMVDVDLVAGYNDVLVEYYEARNAASFSFNYLAGSCEDVLQQ